MSRILLENTYTLSQLKQGQYMCRVCLNKYRGVLHHKRVNPDPDRVIVDAVYGITGGKFCSKECIETWINDPNNKPALVLYMARECI